MSLAMTGRRCLEGQRGRCGGFRRTVSARGEALRKQVNFGNALIVLALCCILFSPLDLFAWTQSSTGTPSAPEAAGSVAARGDGGYVDMESDGDGDRFVDEDGDGIDDRRMKRHQKRYRQRWRDDAQRGSVSAEGGRGTGGSQGHGAGPGPGGGGR